MEPMVGDDTAPSDAELISRVRDGDRAAFGQLYGRHARAAAALARQISVSGAEADDLVAESFARVLDTMLDGRGPDSAFRAYLFTTLRHTAYDRTRKDRRLQFTDDITAHEVAVESDDPVLLQMENSFVAKAFGQLPERWRTILWHTQVEGQSPAEVGLILGMSPNAVTSLAFRAREGLREAYLQVHMAETVAERCRATIDRLGAYTRGGLSKRETAQVEAHLAECDRCPALAAELSEINSGLRGLLAPLLLGSAAAGYIATLPAVPALTQVGASVVTGTGALVKLGAAARVGKTVMSPAVITGGVMAAAVATVIAVVVGIASSGGPQTADPLTQVAPTSSSSSSTSSSTGSGGGGGTSPSSASTGDGGLLAGGSTVSTTSASPTNGGSTGGPGNPSSSTGATTPSSPATTEPLPTTPPSSPAPSSAPSSTAGSPAVTTPTSPTGTTPPAVPSTPTVAPPAAVNVSVNDGISTLTAGRTQTVNLTVTNSGGTTQPAGNAVLAAGPGVSLVGAGIVVPALRNPVVAFAARKAAPGDVICSANVCPLPELAPGATVQVALQVAVTPQATETDVSLTMYDANVIDLQDVTVNSSYQSVSVAPTGPVTAGSNSQFVLTATPAEGVSDPGPVTLPTALSADLYVSGTPQGCAQLDTAAWQCIPDANGQIGPLTLDTVAVPSAGGDQNITVTDAGGRELQSDTPVTITPLDSGASVTMTGPFGGTTVGGETIYCSVPTAGDRGRCGPDNTGMIARDPAIAPELDLQGHTVVWAELTWATAGLTGDDTVTVTTAGVASSVTGIALPVGASGTSQMRAYRQDVTSLITADGQVSISDLAASTQTVDGTTPFGVWSLAVIWADPGLPQTTVRYTNTSTRMVPTAGRPVQITVATTDGPLTSLNVTLWATDLWGTKSLAFGGSTLTSSIRGVRMDGPKLYQTGFDLLSFDASQLGSLSGPITLTDSLDGLRRQDGLWIGPVLAIGPATPAG